MTNDEAKRKNRSSARKSSAKGDMDGACSNCSLTTDLEESTEEDEALGAPRFGAVGRYSTPANCPDWRSFSR